MATRWTMIIEEHRLRAALALVVASTRPDRIDVTNVAFRLRVNLGVAINLAGGGLQHQRALLQRELERVVSAEHAGPQRSDRIPLVVARRSRTRQIVNAIDN